MQGRRAGAAWREPTPADPSAAGRRRRRGTAGAAASVQDARRRRRSVELRFRRSPDRGDGGAQADRHRSDQDRRWAQVARHVRGARCRGGGGRSRSTRSCPGARALRRRPPAPVAPAGHRSRSARAAGSGHDRRGRTADDGRARFRQGACSSRRCWSACVPTAPRRGATSWRRARGAVADRRRRARARWRRDRERRRALQGHAGRSARRGQRRATAKDSPERDAACHGP